MKTPMILPWLSRKGGISEKRAERLWADALRYATAKTGWVGTSQYWRVAIDRLLRLIVVESAKQKQRGTAAEPLRPSMWIYPLIAWYGIFLTASSAWQKLVSSSRAQQLAH